MKKKTTMSEKIIKLNIKIVESAKSKPLQLQIHNRPLSWLGTGISVKVAELN